MGSLMPGGCTLPLPSGERIDYETRLAARLAYDTWEQAAQSPEYRQAVGMQQTQFQNALPQQLQQLGNYQQALGMQQCGCRACQLNEPIPHQWSMDEWDQYLLANMSEEEFLLMRRGRLRRPRTEPALGPSLRAQELLDNHLTAEQQRDLKEFGWFDVEGKGKVAGRLGFRKMQTRKFRLYWAGPSINELKSNGLCQHLCIMSLTPLPRADIMLSYKLLIEADLEKFLKTANRIGPPHM